MSSVSITAIIDGACVAATSGAGIPLYIIIAAAVGGAALIAAIVIIIVCCVRRRNLKSAYGGGGSGPNNSVGFSYATTDATPLMPTGSKKHDYEPLDSQIEDNSNSMQMEVPQKGHVLRTESDLYYN